MPATDGGIEAYVRRFGWALARLPAADRDAIVAEVKSHLYERSEQGEEALRSALAAFGSPELYARSFEDQFALAEVERASGAWPLMRAAARMATRSAAGLFGAFFFGLLYLASFACLVVALMKPVLPQQTGLFVSERVFAFGIIDAVTAAETGELLGYWAIPIGLAGALLLYAAATWMLRRFLRETLRGSVRTSHQEKEKS